VNFVSLCLSYRDRLSYTDYGCNEGELAAFIAYAQAFPKGFLALVDTYETINVTNCSSFVV
jgi:nicotinate phosphoribosyltransferase